MSKPAKNDGKPKQTRAELKSENELLELHRIFLTDIECTFLMAFCQSQYCTESLLFIVAVENFRNIYGAKRLEKWKPWQVLDRHHATGKLDPTNFHKKYNVNMEQVRSAAENIWQMFFDKTAKFEICCSTALTTNIQRRMSQIHVYGPETFSEALVDPLKTLHRDTWPRYKRSKVYEEMECIMDMLGAPTTKEDLNLPKPIYPIHLLPRSVAPDDGSNTPMGVCQKLENYLKDPLLYGELLTYLLGIYTAEDLLFIRSVRVFCMAFCAAICGTIYGIHSSLCKAWYRGLYFFNVVCVI